MKITVVIFIAAFLLGLSLIVVLPLLLGGMPPRPGQAPTEEQESFVVSVADRGVFRSDDGGRTWRSKIAVGAGRKTIAGFKVNDVVFDPRDPNTLYLATDGNGLYVSYDRAESWGQVRDSRGNLGLNSNVMALGVSSADNQQLFLAVFQQNRGRLLKSDDSGRSFESVYLVPLSRYGVFDVQVYARNKVDIVTGQGGYLSTQDGGRTWRAVRWFSDGLVKLENDPLSPAVSYVVSSRGNIFKTSDSGVNWTDITPNFQSFRGSTRGQRLIIDSAGTIYLGSEFGLLRSSDRGANFAPVPIIIPPEVLPVLAVAVDSRAAGHILVSAGSEIYESGDGGESWSILSSPGQGRVTHLAFDPRNSKTVYAVVQP